MISFVMTRFWAEILTFLQRADALRVIPQSYYYYTSPQSFLIRWLDNFGDLFPLYPCAICLSFLLIFQMEQNKEEHQCKITGIKQVN